MKVRPKAVDHPPERPARGKVITFYSYKGGTGRSMALANVAWMLALNGERVLVIDWDLEAPGLHRYFHPFLKDKELIATEGLLDFVVKRAARAAVSKEREKQAAEREKVKLERGVETTDSEKPADRPENLPDEFETLGSEFETLPAEPGDRSKEPPAMSREHSTNDESAIIDYLVPLIWPNDIQWQQFGARAGIDLLAAGRQGPSYSRTLGAFNWIDFFERLDGRSALEAARQQLRSVYDFILIDSRTGVSDTSGICTVEMPDTLVVCFTLNDQGIIGASGVTESILTQRRARDAANPGNEGRPFLIFPVPMRVEALAEHEKRQVALELAQEKFSRFLDAPYQKDLSRYWGSAQMAYYPYYAFEEIPCVFGDTPNVDISLTNSVKRITGYLTDQTITNLPPLHSDSFKAEQMRKEIVGWFSRAVSPVRTCQAAFDQFDTPRQRTMLKVLQRLVQVDAKGQDSVRRCGIEEFPQAWHEVITTLAGLRVIEVTKAIDGAEAVALSDGVILEKWELLRKAIQDDRLFLVWRQSLSASAKAWLTTGRDRSALWRGKLVEEAQRWRDEHFDDLNQLEQDFLTQSLEEAKKQLNAGDPQIRATKPGRFGYRSVGQDKRLSNSWSERKASYDFIVIGSGYGGSITAARLANSPAKPSVCILERGKEWPVGSFPDKLEEVLPEFRSGVNPLGLYEILNYRDISVVKGSGLGGTSLINANVAIIPNREIFERTEWPRSLKYDNLMPYYLRAREVLDAHPHPAAAGLAKVEALDKRAREMGLNADPLNLAVNFTIDGANPYGIHQTKCIDCGDCVSGCNTGAKNTLYMNYLPMAKNGGAMIFTQTRVEWIEKLAGGGWRVHGRYVERAGKENRFTLDARNVILSAGSLNSTEILLRSGMHGLKVSPALGTRFSGNGNFFGLAYNGDDAANVLGYGTERQPASGDAPYPGPTIVSAIRYTNLPGPDRIAIEDLTFPSAAVGAAQTLFTAVIGEDTNTGDEAAKRERVRRDFLSTNQYQTDGALNHTMLYLVTGPDDARGTMVFDDGPFDRDGRMQVEWDNAGRQVLFTRINEELRRHARALGGTFVSNPLWNVLEMRRLITVHPLGGCPMGEDYLHGATDEFGRVFAQDGGIHAGLFVADGALVPSAIGDPLLTISALSERIVERKIEEMQGKPYPQPSVAVSLAGLDPVEITHASETELERIFRRNITLGIDEMLNAGGAPVIDIARRTIRNDQHWAGYLPRGHILNAMSSAIFSGFKKSFHKAESRYFGLTSDTDGRTRSRNLLEEITLSKAEGTLEAGKYILLKYLDPPWQGYYEIFKVINNDLLIGRVYLGQYPSGARVFTFAMTRSHGFDRITVDEHRALFDAGATPTPGDLNGIWRMDVISSNNQLAGAAHMAFELKPDGRLESRYQAMGLFEGMVIPSFTQDHFQLNDFTPFRDEIRKVDGNLMTGKWVAPVPAELGQLLNQSLGILHPDVDGRFGFYYLLTRPADAKLRTSTLFQPLLDMRLPDGLGMKFDEEMVGWFAEGEHNPSAPKPGTSGDCGFKVTTTVQDLNEFIDGVEHEGLLNGTIAFERLGGRGPVTYQIDGRNSRFNYLRINLETREAEMRYHLEFRTDEGKEYTFDCRKYIQKDKGGGMREVLDDYTTLFCHLYEREGRRQGAVIGAGLLKFLTFEDIAAVGNLAGLLRSLRVTGTDDPVLQVQGQMRFLGFAAQFVQRDYDVLSPDIGRLSRDVRAEVQGTYHDSEG